MFPGASTDKVVSSPNVAPDLPRIKGWELLVSQFADDVEGLRNLTPPELMYASAAVEHLEKAASLLRALHRVLAHRA